MANITIPNLPATAAVDGTEQLEAVQNGTSVRVTAAQIASLAQNTQGTVTQINTAGALVGGPITTTGTISLPPDAVTNVYLAEMPANTLKANLTGLTANPTDVTPSALLNTFGSAAGSMLYRDAGVWTALGPGTPGFYLTTTGNQPQWTALSVSPGDIQPSGVSPGTYGNASNVGQFTVAASGQITFANNIPIVIPAGQVTGLGTMAVQNANNVAITGGTMDGVVIGSTSAAQAYFTTIAQGTWNGATIDIAYGGTGATTAATARTNLGLGTMAVQNANNVAITGGTIDGVTIGGGGNPQAGTFTSLTVSGTSAIGTVTSGSWNGNPIPVAYGGTGANNASVARLNLGAAASGANSDITSLTGLTTPLSAPQGGTGFSSYTPGDLIYATASNALGRLNDVAAGNVLKSGGVGLPPAYGKVDVTADITGILTVPNGGTGAATLTGYVYGNGTSVMTASPTIPTTALDYNSVTIGSTVVALGGSAPALAGVTSLTLTQDPTQALQAATKQYVDYEVATVSNLTYHTQVDATTTANLNANYNNGASGVGATLTNAGAFAQFSIDNYTPGSQARVLIKDQTNAAQNGIYVVTTQGDAISVPWVLTRASDFNTPAAGPNGIQAGASVFVQNGQTWGSTSWVMTTTGAITVGTTPLVWTQISSSGNITVTSPLAKVGNVISLGTVPVTLGGTGLTSYTVGDLVYANTTTSLAPLADIATGNVLRSGGVNNPPAWGKLDLTTDVTGVLPVANGGTGTSTALTSGSVVFAGASGVFSQNNANFFWDNVNTRLGIHTATPDASLTILSETQTALPPGALPSGTDFHIVGANNADARITQDAFGSGNYPAYTGRHARGTAALPSASQAGDILSQYTGRGYGASAYNSASTGVFEFVAAENFTNTAQGTYASLHLTATGAASPTEVMRFGPLGQLGVGGASYGTANQLLTSGGSGAAPSWQSGINVTTIDASGAINFTTLTDNISIGASQTSGLLTLGGTAQTANVVLAPSTKTFTLSLGGGVTESGATKTINLGTAGASSSTTAINIGASAAGSSSTTTLYGNVKVNGLTASKPVFTDASSNLTSSGTLLTDQGGTGLTSYTVGDLLYFSAGTALTKLGIGTNGQILTSNGTAPVWTSGSSISVNTATNLAGGATGSVPYQSAASTTTFLSIGAANTVMTSSGTAPQWVTSLTGLTGVSSSSITNTSLTSGRVVYSTTGGAETDSANLTFDGTTLTAANITSGGTWTFSGGTANGVVYLNGSKQATSGSALTFDATTSGALGVGTTPGTFTNRAAIQLADLGYVVSGGTSLLIGTNVGFNGSARIYLTTAAAADYRQVNGEHRWESVASGTAGTTMSMSQNMTLDASGNLGIGTSSPAFKLQVIGSTQLAINAAGTQQILQLNNSDTTAGVQAAKLGFSSAGVTKCSIIGAVYGNGYMAFATNDDTEKMRLDASGNLGLGVTPSAWSSFKGFQFGEVGGLASADFGGSNVQTFFGNNIYYGGSPANFRAIKTNVSSIYRQVGKTHVWGYSESVTANNAITITETMTLDASGNLGIGTSSPGYKLSVAGASGSAVLNLVESGVRSWGVRAGGAATNTFDIADFTAGATRLTIDSSGNLGIGTSSPWSQVSIGTPAGGTAGYFGVKDNTYGGDIRFGKASGVDNNAIAGAWSNNSFLFYTNSTERMRITSAGELLVGTTTSGGYQMAVSGASAGGVTGIKLINTGTTSSSGNLNMFVAGSSYGSFGVSANSGWLCVEGANNLTVGPTGAGAVTFVTNGSERMRITSAGDVGIGTSSPGEKLNVIGGGATTSTVNFTGGSGNDNATIASDYSLVFQVDANNNVGGRTFNWRYGGKGYSDGTSLMTLDASANLLVNATSVNANYSASPKIFCVGGSTPLLISNGDNAGTYLQFDTGAANGNVNIKADARTGSYPPLTFTVGGSERARITSGGDLLVGTTSQLYGENLNVTNGGAGKNCSAFYFNTSDDRAAQIIRHARASGATQASMIAFLDSAGTERGAIRTDGSATAYNTSSDRRLKENITSSNDAGAVIDSIEIVQHDWKSGGHVRYGVIAQDLHKVAPEAVSAGDDGEEIEKTWGVDYSKLVPMLIKEIQSLRKRVAELEAK